MKSIINFFQRILNFFRKYLLKWFVRRITKIVKCIETDLMDKFLETLLKVIRLVICLDCEGFAKNVKGFNARYAFQSKKGNIAASAVFADDRMKVKSKALPDTNVSVTFKDGKSLWEFLMAENPDVFSFVLDNKLSYDGNLNYLMKFAYMAKHMKLMFGL